MRSNNSYEQQNTSYNSKQHAKQAPVVYSNAVRPILTPVTVAQNPNKFKFGIEGFRKEAQPFNNNSATFSKWTHEKEENLLSIDIPLQIENPNEEMQKASFIKE